MRLTTTWNPDSTRARRPRNHVTAAFELLEVRSLLSATAVIRWQMAPQIVLDPNRGNQPELPNTPAYVNPAGGYATMFDASHTAGARSSSTFSWTITDAQGHSTHLAGESKTINLPQGAYKVQLQASGLAGKVKAASATTSIQVKDVLIVSIGDSYASGEGDPDVSGYYFLKAPQWAYSPDPAMERENADAHRSTLAGPAQFALALQQSNPHEAVTFVSVADSGASIAKGLLGPMTSIGDSSVQLPGEIAEVQRIVGTRHIDALTVSIGGNDIGFASQIEGLIENSAVGSPSLATIQSQVNAACRRCPPSTPHSARRSEGSTPVRS